MKKRWFCEAATDIEGVVDQPIDWLIELLNDWKSEGFTHCDLSDDKDGNPKYLIVKREETNKEAKEREKHEKAQRAQLKKHDEAQERKLLAKLKKKYEV